MGRMPYRGARGSSCVSRRCDWLGDGGVNRDVVDVVLTAKSISVDGILND